MLMNLTKNFLRKEVVDRFTVMSSHLKPLNISRVTFRISQLKSLELEIFPQELIMLEIQLTYTYHLEVEQDWLSMLWALTGSQKMSEATCLVECSIKVLLDLLV